MLPAPEPDLPDEAADTHLDEGADEQLADLLDACLRAERAHPGSAARIVLTAPEDLRSDLEQLLGLGRRLSSVDAGELAPAIRQGLRVRIITRIGPRVSLWDRINSVCKQVVWLLKGLWRALVGRR